MCDNTQASMELCLEVVMHVITKVIIQVIMKCIAHFNIQVMSNESHIYNDVLVSWIVAESKLASLEISLPARKEWL